MQACENYFKANIVTGSPSNPGSTCGCLISFLERGGNGVTAQSPSSIISTFNEDAQDGTTWIAQEQSGCAGTGSSGSTGSTGNSGNSGNPAPAFNSGNTGNSG
jgi:hypothetical protein